MAIALAKTPGEAHNTTTGTTQALSYTSTAGNLLVAIVHCATGATITVTSVADNLGNTWTSGPSGIQSGSNTRVHIWYRFNAAAITTVTATTSGATRIGIAVSEWSGVLSSTPATNSAGSAATTAPPPVTVAVPANGLCIGGITYPSTTAPTVAAPFTAFAGAATTVYGANAYHLATTAVTEGPAWTTPNAASGRATIAFAPLAATKRSITVTNRAALTRASTI